MDDAERLILIRALATNMVANSKNGADEDNRPLAELIHRLSFEMDLDKKSEFDYSLE